jgi:hypothetical protein
VVHGGTGGAYAGGAGGGVYKTLPDLIKAAKTTGGSPSGLSLHGF